MEPFVCDYGLDFCRSASTQRFSVLANEGDMTNIDVFDFGCIVFSLFTGVVVRGPSFPNIPGTIPDPFRELIRACWSDQPTMRPSFESIVLKLLSRELALDLSPSELDALAKYGSEVIPMPFTTQTLITVLDGLEKVQEVNAQLTRAVESLQRRMSSLMEQCNKAKQRIAREESIEE
jgi:hypothetical protein